jgi:hypothetical protein
MKKRNKSYHLKCCKFYKNYQYEFYISDKSMDKVPKFVENETNVWACIYRSLNRKRNIKYDEEWEHESIEDNHSETEKQCNYSNCLTL